MSEDNLVYPKKNKFIYPRPNRILNKQMPFCSMQKGIIFFYNSLTRWRRPAWGVRILVLLVFTKVF